jgi:hypothetical protein
MNTQQRFLEHSSHLIREDNHPLQFLLNEQGNVSTMANRTFSIHSSSEWALGKPQLSIERPKGDRTSSEDIARAYGGTVVSCDACHVQSRMSGTEERFALGIAGEDNRSHGRAEADLKKDGFIIEHEAISIGGVPVIRSSAIQWEAAGLLRKGTVESSIPDRGWSHSQQQNENSEKIWRAENQEHPANVVSETNRQERNQKSESNCSVAPSLESIFKAEGDREQKIDQLSQMTQQHGRNF